MVHPAKDKVVQFPYYDKVVRGTEREDGLVIVQFLKEMVGQTFLFLNYYKEIPVSYNAKLVSVEKEMAEFDVHEYQAKVISLEKKVLIRAHEKSTVLEDIVGESFYVSTARKKVILTRFHYTKIRSDLRHFVRVSLEGRRADVDVYLDSKIIPASVIDISLGGVSLKIMGDLCGLESGKEVNLILKLEVPDDHSFREIAVTATVLKVAGDAPPYICFLEFHSERLSRQSLAHYINRRQVEIIRELKAFSS